SSRRHTRWPRDWSSDVCSSDLGIDNLFLVGRNGMHKYNNQDHSMLTAMHAVDGIASGHVNKKSLWEINTEQEYHEEKAEKAKARSEERRVGKESRDQKEPKQQK